MTGISRSILINEKAASFGFISVLGMLCFQPRKFFRLMHRFPMKHNFLAAILILTLLSYSAVLQAELHTISDITEQEDELSPGDELEPLGLTSSSDPSQSWMTGLSAVGKQVLYWAVLMLVLSVVSLFKGKTPDLGRNLQIAVWSSFPFALMAALQITFLMGGGQISAIGFTGFLDEWQSYYELQPYMQSAVYTLAAQLSFFSLWSFVLLYKGAQESLSGNRIVVAFVLLSWLMMLTTVFAYEHYQYITSYPSYDDEIVPNEAIPLNDPFYTEPESEMSDEGYP